MRPLPSRPVRAHNISRLLSCLLCGLLLLTVAAARAVSQSGISYRSSATANNGSGASSTTVNKPAGTVTNDVMLATIFVRGLGTTPSVTAPSGWTLIRQDNIDDGVTAVMPSYYRVAGTSEPANYTWTFDSSRLAVAVISSYSGVSTSSPVNAHNGQWIPTSTTITAPSVTTTVANTMLVGSFGLMEGGQSISPAAGMTERVDTSPVSTNLTLEMSDELRVAAGATGARDATASFEDNSIGQLIALNPLGGGGNNSPTVSITSPANNATFTAPANITINASATDNDGTISQVEFFQGTTSLFVDTSAPYSYTWSNVGAGSYTLTAKATDNLGATTTSAALNVTVNSSTGGSSGWTDTGANVVLTDAVDRVGIGTTTPLHKLDVDGNLNVRGGTTFFKQSTGLAGNEGANISIGATANNEATLSLNVFRAGAYISRFAVDNFGRIALQPNGDANVGIGTTTPNSNYKLDVNGNTNVTGDINLTGTINAKYQDVAEWVPCTQALAAGTVVSLDPTKSNHVEASFQAYDTRVAGVISVKPGLSLGEMGPDKVLVATTGRVRVKVDATRAPILVGDLLVTSNIPGMAMKSQPINISGAQFHRPGTIIGKALEPLAKGTGEILVLLSLQ